MTTTFKDFNLKEGVQKAIDKLGYTEPTQIQKEVWDAASIGSNVVGQSQTGTGKTTAFLLPLLQAIDNKDRFPQVLIVAPTRELVQQIRDDIMKLTEFFPMRSMCLMGGKSMRFQREDLRYGPQFIVATPGRLIEFMQNGYFDVTKITHFVLDEVDRMLDMGFIEDVDRIWGQLTSLKQTMTFSATINNEIKDIINRHCKEFVHIRVGDQITVDKIDHTYIDIAHEHKFATLVHLLEQHKGQKTIIFAQTKRNTEVITRALKQGKHTCAYLNGDLDQRERTRALRAFKDGICKILITTDVAARGLNMDNVELVVNFDVPREPESYIHRIGRTGRAGATGKALMLVSNDEVHLLMDIEKTQKIKLKKSEQFKGVKDEDMAYIDVNLDRPLPPSDKKRRMVARSIARDRGGYVPHSESRGGRSSGGYQGRSSGGYAGRSSGSSDRGGYAGRSSGGYAGRSSDAPRREYAPRDAAAPRSEGGYQGRSSGGYAGRSSDAPRREYAPRDAAAAPRSEGGYQGRSSGGYASRSSDAPRREYAPREGGYANRRGPSSSSQFDAKPESRRDRNTTYGERAFGERGTYSRSRPVRSIGGYDPVEVVQTNVAASSGPRPPRDFSFNEQPRSDRPARTGDRPARSSGERFGRKPSSGSDTPRPRRSSFPKAA